MFYVEFTFFLTNYSTANFWSTGVGNKCDEVRKEWRRTKSNSHIIQLFDWMMAVLLVWYTVSKISLDIFSTFLLTFITMLSSVIHHSWCSSSMKIQPDWSDFDSTQYASELSRVGFRFPEMYLPFCHNTSYFIIDNSDDQLWVQNFGFLRVLEISKLHAITSWSLKCNLEIHPYAWKRDWNLFVIFP